MQAIIDVPAETFESETDFWVGVTASSRGDVHPEYPQYLHLKPATGDMHLEMQRLDDEAFKDAKGTGAPRRGK